MGDRRRRRVLTALALGAVVLTACHRVVPPAPPAAAPPAAPAAPPAAATTTTTAPPTGPWCQSAPAPSATDHVAVVDEGGSRPAVVEFQASTTAQVQQQVAQLDAQGEVLAVGQDKVVSALPTYPQGANPSYATQQWDFLSGYVDFPGAWNANPATPDTGAGVRVAVIDTGVEADHPDLAGHVVQGKDFVVSDQTKSDFGRIDGNGHGTHVAGTIAAKDDGNGVVGGALDATIVPARVLDCNGSGSTADVASGILWAADPSGGHAQVISMSLGGSASSTEATAIQYALAHGVVVVAAAGNSGSPTCDSASDSSPTASPPTYPAAYAADQVNYPGMIAVGATGDHLMSRASYSNCNPYVTVVAPGSSIYSTYENNAGKTTHTPTYAYLSGTSMATPHVSAAAALVLAACPADTPAQVRTRIITGTQAVTGFAAGVGMVNAKNATAAC